MATDDDQLAKLCYEKEMEVEAVRVGQSIAGQLFSSPLTPQNIIFNYLSRSVWLLSPWFPYYTLFWDLRGMIVFGELGKEEVTNNVNPIGFFNKNLIRRMLMLL